MPEDRLAAEVRGVPAAETYIGHAEAASCRANELGKSEEPQLCWNGGS